MGQDRRPPPGDRELLPAKYVTVDQIVAMNLRHWRRAAEITQQEFGLRIGWSPANLSAAERSADGGKERRRFDATTITSIALALGVPIAALFLPPADDGITARYRLTIRDDLNERDNVIDMGDFMGLLVMPDSDDDTPIMDAYRDRFNAAAARYLEPEWAARAAHWLRDAETPTMRADRAARLRDRRNMLLAAAADFEELADAIERADGSA